MKASGIWKRKRPKPVLTISWTLSGARFALWETPLGRRRIYLKGAVLSSADCTPEAYRKVLGSFASEAGSRGFEVIWIVLKETYPTVFHNGGGKRDFPVKLPDWMCWCWQCLTAEELPYRLLSGMAVMEHELKQWPRFMEPGTGYCLTLEGQAIFLGFDNALNVRRLSQRAPLAGDRGIMDPDWLLQTRTLFRNRTGRELKRIFVEEDAAWSASWEGGIPFELIPERKPMALLTRGSVPFPDTTLFLHASALSARDERSCSLSFPLLKRRLQFRKWDRRLRATAALLFCGWSFMLLNACRHEALPSLVSRPDSSRLEDARERLIHRAAEWADWKRHEAGRQAPLSVAGMIASTLPESIEVERLGLRGQHPDSPADLRIELEGTFDGTQSAAVFREWIDRMLEKRVLHEVGNLSLRRESGKVAFSFEGIKHGGPAR